jgi:formylglycine-generating enzyme required for sulfatase activity
MRRLARALLALSLLLPVSSTTWGEDGGTDWFYEGYVLMDAGRYADAAAHFERGLIDDPTNGTALYILGVAYLNLGDDRAGIEMLRAAMDLDPGSDAGRGALERLRAIPGYEFARGPALPLRAGAEFRDCEVCPRMVVLPPGTASMGTQKGEPGASDDESPRHTVSLPRAFAVSKFEVSFAEWDACVRARHCARVDDHSWGRGALPAINVSWRDAQAYVSWLARKTGKLYRLLSETEWEYAARARSDAARYWGDSLERTCNYANVFDATAARKYTTAPAGFACDDSRADTSMVGSYLPNAFGLHDMLGNVWEWVADCYHPSYRGAPADGQVWDERDCMMRVARGGSWDNGPADVRAARRAANRPTHHAIDLGLRVARALP